MSRPEGWKNYEDFAAGIDANRLPQSGDLIGKSLSIGLAGDAPIELSFESQNSLNWKQGNGAGQDWYEALLVAPNTYFIDLTFNSKPQETLTLLANLATRRVLGVRSYIRDEVNDGKPRVGQDFKPGIVNDGTPASGFEPGPTRDLIGMRARYRYSPNHLYEHTYLSSERYCWQNLVGEQRGHGDVDLATTYKFADNIYLFTFREFKIPVASIFVLNFDDMMSTGKFLGLTKDGKIENNPAGAFIEKASMTFYNKGEEPV